MYGGYMSHVTISFFDLMLFLRGEIIRDCNGYRFNIHVATHFSELEYWG